MISASDEILTGLPGEMRIRQGLEDLSSGAHSLNSYLVSIAAPRLVRAGLLPADIPQETNSELFLYRLLRKEGGNAYSRYNALLRELVSFEHALDARMKNCNGLGVAQTARLSIMTDDG